MPPFERHVFICGNQREPGHPRGCCDPAGADTLQKAFKKALTARGLNRRIRANRAGCLDQCEHGPTVVVYPEGVWYGGVTLGDVDEIVDRHLAGGEPVSRLRLADECVNAADCVHKQARRNA
jgi:(2Fe-2S) ferredoxin